MLKHISRNVTIVKKDETSGTKPSKTVMFEDIKEDKFLSIFLKTSVKGPEINLAKGPRDDLLL